MTFEQAFYTSCSSGLRGGKGFQINAATPTIEASTLELIERIGVYVPPVSSPTRPTSEETEHFPLALLFYRVQDGRTILGQSKYVGVDYSGRYGNYFSHCLVTQDLNRAQTAFLPIELWRSRTWTTQESTSVSIPSIDCPEVGGVIGPLRVNEFLTQRNRLEHYAALLTAVEGALTTGKRVVVVDESESIALWIASVSYALPRHLAWLLTFNTYVKNPYQTDVLIAGTTRDSDFAFSPQEIDHQYSVFDFAGNRFSRLTPSNFAMSAAAAYRDGRSEDLAAFGGFVNRVAPDLSVRDVAVAFGCYALSNGMPAEGFDNSELLKWCAPRVRHLQPDFIRSLAAAVGRSTSVSPELIVAFTDLHTAVISGGSDAPTRDAVQRAYIAFVIQHCDALDGNALSGLVDGLKLSATARTTGQELRGAWFEKVRSMRDPNRLCAFLALGDRLGLLADNGEIIRRLAETVIAAGLGDPLVQQAVLRQLATPFATELISGIAAFLQSRASDGQVFHALRFFLIRPEVMKGLEAYATDQSAAELYYRLIGEQGTDRPELRGDSFRHCLTVTQRLRADPTPSRLEVAFDAVWQNALPTIAEALLIMDSTSDNTLAKTSIPGRFGDALARGLDLTRDDPQRDELAQRLRGGALLAALGEGRYIVDAWVVAKRLRSPESDPGQSISTAIQAAGRLQDGPKASLSELAARRMFDIQDREKHCDLLLRANAALGQPFVSIYARCAQSFLSRWNPPDARLVAKLFWIWSKASAALGDQQSRVLLNDVLRRSVKRWRQNDFQAAQTALGIEGAMQAAWTHWMPRAGRPRAASSGILARLTRWFVICLAITIGLAAGILLARRLFRPSEDNVQVSEPSGGSGGSDLPSTKARNAPPRNKKPSTKEPAQRRHENDR